MNLKIGVDKTPKMRYNISTKRKGNNKMKTYLVDVYLKGWGCDNYLVNANNEEEAKKACLERCKEETDFDGWEVIGVKEWKY